LFSKNYTPENIRKERIIPAFLMFFVYSITVLVAGTA
jgi:hypothetical protein